MNYFAHGRRFLDRPYFVAGTALPDWLNVVNRKVRVRERMIEPLRSSFDSIDAEIADGVGQHHFDDGWFHSTRAFAELSMGFAVELREALPANEGLRASFLGHVLVEVLLDDCLVSEYPEQLTRYYECLEAVDPGRIADFVRRVTGKDATGLGHLIPQFLQVRFLYDYAEDAKLLFRMNQVMKRVGLEEIPGPVVQLIPGLRQAVQQRRSELLAAPEQDEPTSNEYL